MSQAPACGPRRGLRMHRCATTFLAVVGLMLFARPANAKTFVLPHMLEASGRITNTQYTFDTTIFMTYSGGRAGCPDGGGAVADLYLFDQATSQPMVGGGGSAVCNPCTFDLSSSTPSHTVLMEDLLDAAGGFGGASIKLGFGVVVVSGDVDAVQLQSSIVNSHTGPFDLSSTYFNPREYTITRKKVGPSSRAFVIPHILEKSGTISTTQFTFDTTIFATYVGGIGDAPDGGGAEVQLYLYDQTTGQPMTGAAGTDVCNPCLLPLNSAGRKRSFNIDNLITTRGGGFDSATKLGFGIIVVGGDVDGVALQGFVVNSHTSAFDLSVFGFDPQPIAAAASTAVDDQAAVVPRPSPLVGFPNPFNPHTTLAFTLAAPQDVTLRVHDAAGRLVRTLLHESRAAGEHAVAWDGKDDAGRPLASGVYHASLVARDGNLNTKLVLLQ